MVSASIEEMCKGMSKAKMTVIWLDSRSKSVNYKL